MQLFDLVTSFSGAFTISGAYGEGLWRLGDALGRSPVRLDQIDISLMGSDNGMFPVRGLPATVYGVSERGGGTGAAPLFIEGFLQFPHVAGFNTTYIEGFVSASPITREGGTLPRWKAAAHNATAGGIVIGRDPYTRTSIELGGRFLAFSKAIGTGVAPVTWNGRLFDKALSSVGMPYWATETRPLYEDNLVPIYSRPF